MKQCKIPAVFMRGGTSKAVMFLESDLPDDRSEWDAIFQAAIGSPDPNGRQLNGMGGGLSSLSKVCIIGPSDRDDADIDYTFAQVSVDRDNVGYGANCGNMSSAVGPFAVDEGLVTAEGDEVLVRVYNTNTDKIIHSRFTMDGDVAAVDGGSCAIGFSRPRWRRDGTLAADGQRHRRDRGRWPGRGRIVTGRCGKPVRICRSRRLRANRNGIPYGNRFQGRRDGQA